LRDKARLDFRRPPSEEKLARLQAIMSRLHSLSANDVPNCLIDLSVDISLKTVLQQVSGQPVSLLEILYLSTEGFGGMPIIDAFHIYAFGIGNNDSRHIVEPDYHRVGHD
jgi:hypothetical protein